MYKLYVFTVPAQGEPIKASLKAWTNLKDDQRVVHQTIRRLVGIAHTPKTLTIQPDHLHYQTILDLGMTSAEMLAESTERAEDAAQVKVLRTTLANIKELLG